MKNVLLEVQKIQRSLLGKATIFVETFVFDDGDFLVRADVFVNDKPNSFYFYNYESEEKHKETMKLLKKLIKKI